MIFRLLGFLGTITLILSAASIYLAYRTLSLWPWARQHSKWTWGIAVVFILVELGSQLTLRTLPPGTTKLILQWISYTGLGVFATFFFYMVLVDLLWLPFYWFLPFSDTFKNGVFSAVILATFLSVGIGTFQALSFPKTQETRVSIPGLPPELEGFRIAQITDLHAGGVKQASFTREIVAHVNSLNPDLIALTGDMVDGSPSDLKGDVDALKNLRAPYGSYFVTGNHEYYWGAQEWSDTFRSINILPLLNQHTKISIGNATLVVAGITDKSAGQFIAQHRSDATKALASAIGSEKIQEPKRKTENSIKILLAHQPASYTQALENGFDLMLSGHTHAGQFFPWKIIVKLVYPYYSGLQQNGKLWIYTSAGTGFWGPPNRFIVPGEISLIVLTK